MHGAKSQEASSSNCIRAFTGWDPQVPCQAESQPVYVFPTMFKGRLGRLRRSEVEKVDAIKIGGEEEGRGGPQGLPRQRWRLVHCVKGPWSWGSWRSPHHSPWQSGHLTATHWDSSNPAEIPTFSHIIPRRSWAFWWLWPKHISSWPAWRDYGLAILSVRQVEEGLSDHLWLFEENEWCPSRKM